MLDDLAMLALGSPLTQDRLKAVRRRMTEGQLTLDGYVSELLADERFSRNVAPEIVFNKKAIDLSEEISWMTLRTDSARNAGDASLVEGRGGARKIRASSVVERPVYFLRAPCSRADAVAVHPWWALDTEVLVCSDSYQPTHLREPGTGWYCGGSNLDPARSSFCGCGPGLVNCVRDEEQGIELRSALRDELTRTVAHVVENDLPLERLFTMNETVRTGYSEFFYQRWQVIQGERASVSDLRSWPTDTRARPRVESTPGEHAGLLTSPHMLLYGDTPRARLRNYFHDMWCVTPGSVNVSTEQVLGLGTTDLRDGDGWKRLAAMPVCTSCHARLDYGMQFFSGYPSSFVGVVFRGNEHGTHGSSSGPARGLLYGDSLRDLRGETTLSPYGFSALAVKQPEFSACMVRDVTDHVFQGEITPEDRTALREVFDRDKTLRAVMHEALLRFARRPRDPQRTEPSWTGEAPSSSAFSDSSPTSPSASSFPSSPSSPSSTTASSAVSSAIPSTAPDSSLAIPDRLIPPPALLSMVERDCRGCHASGDHGFLRETPWPRSVVQKMLRQVAFGDMPPLPNDLDPGVRQSMTRGLIDVLWKGESARIEARRYFDGGMRTLPVHRGSALMGLLDERAGSHDDEASSWTFSDADRHDAVQARPSFLITFAMAALRTCKAAGWQGKALDACLQRSLDLRAATKPASTR